MSLRVVVPHTEMHPLTDRALHRWAPSAERIDVSTSETAYWELLAGLWAAGEPFAVIEHDIEIHEHVIPSFVDCPQPWCVFPYVWRWGFTPSPALSDVEGLLTQALGCTRFGAACLKAHPDLLDHMGRRETTRSDWAHLDILLACQLRARGYTPHAHLPEVRHHAWPDGYPRCACGEEHE